MPSKKSTLKNKNRCFRRKYRSTRRRGGSFGRGRPVLYCPICQERFASSERVYNHWVQSHPEIVAGEPAPPVPAANQLDVDAAPPRPRGRPPGASAAAAAAAVDAPIAAAAAPRPRGRPPGASAAAAAAAAAVDAPIAAAEPPRPRGRPPGAAAAARAAAAAAEAAAIDRALLPAQPSSASAAVANDYNEEAHAASAPVESQRRPRGRPPSLPVPPPPAAAAARATAEASAAAAAAIVRALPPPSEATAAIEAEAAAHHDRRGRPPVAHGLAADMTLADPRTIPENIISLNSSASCFDSFEGNEPVISEFLNESCDNLVIFYRPAGRREFIAACCTFTQLRTFLKDGSHLFFQCVARKSWESYSKDSEAQRGPHFLKLFTQSGNIFVDYKQMKQKYIERQNMIFLDFDRIVPLTISYGMSAEMQQVGANHCQDRSAIDVYKIII